MPPAARQFDPTGHPGIVATGNPRVRIGGQLAATVDDTHVCMMPPTAGPHGPGTFMLGSTSVKIGGSYALRQGDSAKCGSPVTTGFPTVLIGG